MFLKSIEVRGFKSFADKTELIFKKGVTGIVGPNGSGKSNISDAVRWVLGEQSVKSLRGSKMEDVIFAGTQYRKSLGLCQVSLMLDNSDKKLPLDYSEVTISRRLYRSGDSEYYINNTQCRLKDIQELFMDTGIGKEGYSIIGQGKIDAVLSGKPEERRSLLEEAAGIVKFKTRKQEADKKLANTEQNLIRIDDILNTYNETIEPLKEESEKTKIFLKMSEELKEREVNLTILFIEKIEAKLKEINEAYNLLKNNEEKLKKEREEYKEKIIKLNNELEVLDKDNSQKRENYYDYKSKVKDIENEVIILKEKINNLNESINLREKKLKINKEKITQLKEEKDILENDTKELKAKLEAICKNIETTNKEVKDFNDLFEHKTMELKKLKENQIEIVSAIANEKNNVMVLENEKNNLKNKEENINRSCNTYRNSININLKTKVDIEEEIKKIKNNIENLEKNLKENTKSIVGLKNSLYHKEKNLKQYSATHSKFEANYQMLCNLEKHYEGYNRSVKTLMEHIDKGKILNVTKGCFLLGDIIKVDEYLEKAMEVALGGAISNIITKDENIAKTLIKYLKYNNIGRATFLPLTIIKGKKINLPYLHKEAGFVGIASELIKFNSKFSNIIDYVLGKTVIAKDMDSALNIAKKLNYSVRIVTLEGEVINPGGSLTGGSIKYRTGSSIIGRKREIEETKQKIEETKVIVESLMEEISKVRSNIKALDEENLNIKDSIYHNNIDITKFEGKLNSVIDETQKLKSTLNTSKDEIALIENKIEKLDFDIHNKNEKLQESIKNQELNSFNIENLEKLLLSREEEAKKSREILTNIKIEKAKLEEMHSNRLRETEDRRQAIEEISMEINNFNKENKYSMNSIENFKYTIIRNEKSVENLLKYIKILENEFKEYDINRIKIKETLDNLKNKKENLDLILSKKQQELHKQDIQNAKYEAEKENLYIKLNEEFSLTYAEALDYKKEIKDMTSYKNKIYSLKEEISKLGTINLKAIEEYKKLNEKITFMEEQKQDLIKSKEQLINVIDEMTNKMKRVFSENFNILRKYFNETFKELFKGGSADLILCEGDELTANIDIKVQPPGKKLQNINLMSGGEKGLAAIALLFAILKMKPTPFCILDEIEAALDDINVVRYAEFLNQLSSNIQFIVITHRKGTMEACDALYGITMEEKGVSKIISVDLASEREVAATI
ncbi:chromosome segregation protein SMC [Clostridium niameyense]|uniref:chromosome segregation protein SMC n=1 Tax=Clostridium niameyense TaxID=1622073 RepID=UPI00067F555D|nr:chromosome segregation protein SMC [Clostridium niameyense]